MTSRTSHTMLALVLVAVFAILGVKAYVARRNPATLPTAQDGVPTTVDAVPGVIGSMDCDLDEPFPALPAAQVQWVLCQHRPAMVLFYSDYCRPCRMMDALVQMVKPDYADVVTFVQVRYDDPANAGLLRWGKVGTIPAACFLTASGEISRVAGTMSQKDLRAELARIAATAEE